MQSRNFKSLSSGSFSATSASRANGKASATAQSAMPIASSLRLPKENPAEFSGLNKASFAAANFPV